MIHNIIKKIWLTSLVLSYLNPIHDFHPHMSSMKCCFVSNCDSACILRALLFLSPCLVVIHVHALLLHLRVDIFYCNVHFTGFFLLCFSLIEIVFNFGFQFRLNFSKFDFTSIVHVLMFIDFQEFSSLYEDPCWRWTILLILWTYSTQKDFTSQWIMFTYIFVVCLSSCYLESCFYLQLCKNKVLQK